MKMQKLSNVLYPFTDIKNICITRKILMVNIVYMNSLSEQGVKAIKSQFNKVIQKILSLKMSASFVHF